MRCILIFIFTSVINTFAFSQVFHDTPAAEKTKPKEPCHCGIGFQFNHGKYEKPNTVAFEFFKKFGTGYIPTAFGYDDYRSQILAVGTELGSFGNDYILGPKLTYEYTWILLCARSEFVWYTNFSKSDPRFSLGGGISIFGWVGVYYLYQFQLSKHQMQEINDHKFSFTIRLPLNFNKKRRS